MIAAPLDGDLHLEILSRLMVMLMEPEFCAALRSAKTADEFLSVIDKKKLKSILMSQRQRWQRKTVTEF